MSEITVSKQHKQAIELHQKIKLSRRKHNAHIKNYN